MAKSNSFFNIDMLVLSLLKVKDCYGYELVKLIKEISNGSLDIKEGTLYPVVHSLLKKEYKELFPRLGDRTRFNRTKRNLHLVISKIRGYISEFMQLYS